MSEGQSNVGVGPWPGAWPVAEDGSPDPRYDVSLLERGDRRNVVDRYRYWTHEAIMADLDSRRHEFHVGVENWGHDFNIGSVIRTANAMGAAAFHIIGRRRWNRRGAMVTDRYQHEHHHPSVADLVAWASTAGPAATREGARNIPKPTGPGGAEGGGGAGTRIPVIGVDNLPGARPLETYDLPRHCLLLFGQEGPGLTDEAVAACDVVLEIGQFGSTRSMNAGAAAAIAMHAWVRRHVFAQPVPPTP